MKNPYLHITALCLAFGGQLFAAKTVPNYPVANLVLGQPGFVTGAALSPTSSFSLTNPTAVVVDPISRKVFVADEGNGRLLRYSSADALTNGAGAEAVFGNPSFGDNLASTGQQGMSGQLRGLFLDRRGRLWVADRNNNRVVCFEAAAYRSSYPYADHVFGQPDFTTVTSGTTAAKMDWPQGIWVDTEDRLWVAEYSNNRVLRFDSISTKANGANADGVLGQSLFTTAAPGSGAANMSGPVGISVSPAGTLFVGEYDGNNRVLRFANAATLANGANATGVLGQPNFATTSSGLSASKLKTASGLWCTPDDSLWVVDESNNRVLRFDKASTLPSGSAATCVVGQANFTSKLTGITNRTLGSAPGYFACVDGTGSLWMPDWTNNRVLRYPPDVTRPLLSLSGTVSKTTTKKSVVIKGTASDAYGVTKVQFMVGNGALKNATGTTSWKLTAPLSKGKNTITIFATDSVGNLSLDKVIKIKRTTPKVTPQLLISEN